MQLLSLSLTTLKPKIPGNQFLFQKRKNMAVLSQTDALRKLIIIISPYIYLRMPIKKYFSSFSPKRMDWYTVANLKDTIKKKLPLNIFAG